ncbi:unnamed protein product [Allacma fusca]|uniref:Carboxylesterase type B domain-containing protein n=1 Tax=Allacma fusca TaxID=39272 RepID=A0A8J2P3D9_9HEXA|nr:unnamed protein product [Allacma fusca]
MKDQVAALNWVKKNIHSFGGDPSRVTIFGTGTGAASVSYHILSPLSTGLFHRGISQSGNALCPWAFVRNPKDFADEMGHLMNCSVANTFTIAACLKQANARDIIIQQQKLVEWNAEAISLVPFAPVVESIEHSIETGPVFLHEPPMKLLREGRFRKVPWLTGVNSADGLTFPAASILNSKTALKDLDTNWKRFAPLIFGYKDLAPNPISVSQKIRDFYFGSNGGIIDHNVRENFSNALSDRNFFRCARNCALLYAKESPVWIYYFTYKSNSSILNSYGLRDLSDFPGVAHSDELQYLFKMKTFPEIKHNSNYFEFSQSLISLWVSFASEGRPGELWHGAEKWNPVPNNQINSQYPMKMYRIDEYTEVIDEPFLSRLNFWDKLRLLPPQSAVFPSISRNYHPDSNINSASGKTLANKLFPGLCLFVLLNFTFDFVL